MLIATFRPTTGWSGKTITFDNEQFILEGVGPLSTNDVLTYDRQGHLEWAYGGLRDWVEATAKASAAPPTGSTGLKGFEWYSSKGAAGSKPSGLRTPWGILTPLTIIGLLLVIIGLIVTVGAIGADVSVPTDYGDRVNNIGLINDQRNGIVGGLVVAVIGGVLMVIAYSRGELDDWLKRAPAAAGHKSVADRQRGPAGVGESQSRAPTPLMEQPAPAAPQTAAVAQTRVVAPHVPNPSTIVAPPVPVQPLAPGPGTSAQADPRTADTLVERPASAAPHAATQTDTAAPPAAVEPRAPGRATSIADAIAKLAELREKGMLTDEEFSALKARLME